MDILETAARKIAKAKHPLILTGAGVSAESGVPTFRGENGLWKNHRAEELATPEAFQADPKLVWEWYNWRKELISKCEPNPAHFACAELSQKIKIPIITQNVDGLHLKTGSADVIEMHGNIFKARYVQTDEVFAYPDISTKGKIWQACERGEVRPHIVWFGEPLEKEVLSHILDLVSKADLMLVAGTSRQVYPAAAFVIEVLSRKGVIIEVNISEKERDYSQAKEQYLYLEGKAGEILPKLVERVSKHG